MKVVIHIDQVILSGLPVTAAQLPVLRAALEQELQSLFRASTAAGRMRADATQKLVARPFEYRTDSGPARLGRLTAGAVHSATQGRLSQ